MTAKSCISRSLSGLDDSPPTLCPIPSCIAFINSDVDFCRKQQHTECTNLRFTEQRKLWIQDSKDFVQHGGIQKDENCDYHTRQLIEENTEGWKQDSWITFINSDVDFCSHTKKYRTVIEGRNKQTTKDGRMKTGTWQLYNVFLIFDMDFCMINLRKYGTVIEMYHTELKYTSLQRNAV